MSNKRFRTPAAPQVSQRAVKAAMEGKTHEEFDNSQMLAQVKRYLHKVVQAAEDCLVGADTNVSIREGLTASRQLLTVIKHEQRIRERTEKTERDDQAKSVAVQARAAKRGVDVQFDEIMTRIARQIAQDGEVPAKPQPTAPPEPMLAA